MSHGGRYASRYNHRDANERTLVQIAERLGVVWQEGGPLDGWVFRRGHWEPVEIKNPDGRNRLQPRQKEFIEMCRRIGASVHIWRSEGDVLASLGALTAVHENGDGV